MAAAFWPSNGGKCPYRSPVGGDVLIGLSDVDYTHSADIEHLQLAYDLHGANGPIIRLG